MGSRQVRRGDSAEEMHAASPGKQHHQALSSCTSTIEELSPLAGTVGIELVPQTLALMASSQTESSSATQQPAKDVNTQPASAPAGNQQQQQPRPQEGSQQHHLAEMLSDEEADVYQQVGVASHGTRFADSSDPASEGQATAVLVGYEHNSQQHKEPPYQSHGSGSPSGQHECGHESDDEHAVLIAASQDRSCDNDEGQMQGHEAKMSKPQSAAAERHRLWYKERAVQLTILG